MNHKSAPDTPEQPAAKPPSVNRADYWVGVLVLVFVAAFFITVTAICYGIIVTPPTPPSSAPRIAFPWIGWFTAMLTAPALILGFAQYVAGKKPDETGASPDSKETAWAGQIPRQALRLYRILRDAPMIMVSAALIGLGATLLVIDGAFSLVSSIILALIPYAPYFIGAITVLASILIIIMAWFRHASNRLAAEYAFRREVLEKTGVILLNEKGNAILPPGLEEGTVSGLRPDTSVSSRATLLPASIQQAPVDAQKNRPR